MNNASVLNSAEDAALIVLNAKQEKLNILFDEVCDKDDWKAPIVAVVDEDKVDDYIRAIIWFTGTEASVTRYQYTNKVTLYSVGYRMGAVLIKEINGN